MDLHNLFQRAGLMFMIHDILVEVCYMVTLCKSICLQVLWNVVWDIIVYTNTGDM